MTHTPVLVLGILLQSMLAYQLATGTQFFGSQLLLLHICPPSHLSLVGTEAFLAT